MEPKVKIDPNQLVKIGCVCGTIFPVEATLRQIVEGTPGYTQGLIRLQNHMAQASKNEDHKPVSDNIYIQVSQTYRGGTIIVQSNF